MIDPLDKEINVDEIMERIREEVRRRKGLSQPENFKENGQAPSQPQPIQPMPASSPPNQQTSAEKSFDHFLWEHGRKHKKIIKKVPILSFIAKKQHQRLLHKFISFSSAPPPSYSSSVNFDVLPYYINYHGFLEQAKRGGGLKGRVKFYLFKFIRFFGWWQEQINRALYQELIDQKARMDERDKRVQELHHQQMDGLKMELSERDKVLGELGNRLNLLGQAKDELSRELSDQRVKSGEAERRVEELLHQQSAHLRGELAERDKVLKDLRNRFSLFGQVKEELYLELGDQKSKIDEIRKWVESLLNQQIDEVKSELAERDKVIESLNNRLIQFGRVEEELNQGMEDLKFEFTGAHKSLREEIESTKKELSGLLEIKSAINYMTEEMRNHKHEILDQQRRLTLLLEEARKRLPKPIGPKQIKNMLKEEDHLFDAMYVAFEDQFRGTREEIKERLKVYLPYIKEANVETSSSLILDLGCGRGEWLKLLKENGFIARGVDLNRVMVRQCQEIGLDVIESDIIEYLRNQQPNSLSAITGFHILEHLSLKTIISLFDEALRVLQSGGVVIFETPNPENLIVASCNFYLDPTHRNPIPPRLLNFLIESRGFNKTEIVRLHPNTFFREGQKTSTAVKSLISLFNKEQDYSIIAYKE